MITLADSERLRRAIGETPKPDGRPVVSLANEQSDLLMVHDDRGFYRCGCELCVFMEWLDDVRVISHMTHR